MIHLKGLTALALALCALAAAAPAQEPGRPDASGVALETLRAGNAADPGPALSVAEREAVAAAASPSLEALRAADLSLSDREVKIILYTAGVIILLAILI